jgi:hypothetical protein
MWHWSTARCLQTLLQPVSMLCDNAMVGIDFCLVYGNVAVCQATSCSRMLPERWLPVSAESACEQLRIGTNLKGPVGHCWQQMHSRRRRLEG